MPEIPYFDREQAPEELRTIYDSLVKEYGGSLPALYRVMFHSPEGTNAVRAFYTKALPSWKLDPKLHALSYILTAQLYDCTY